MNKTGPRQDIEPAPLDWAAEYRSAPFTTVTQTGWDTFSGRAECWGGLELVMTPTTLRILNLFAEAQTAEDAFEELLTFIDVSRANFASTLSGMFETGLLGLDGVMHSRLVPKAVKKMRLGRPGDGGYVVPRDFASIVDGLLAFGVGDDLSFENSFCDHHTGTAIAFDHTVDTTPYMRPRVDFVPKGVAPCESPTMVTMATALRDSPFERPMVKMDIEGAEWPILAACGDSFFRQVPVMVFELHGMLTNTPLQNRAITRLLEHHEPIHVHANNLGRELRANGCLYPEWLEVTFLHRSLLSEASDDHGSYPTKDDYPNWDGRKDPALDWWQPSPR